MDRIFDYFFQPQNGILGVIIIMLLLTIVFGLKVIDGLIKRIDIQNNEIKLLNEALNIVQEKRISDYDKNSGALIGLGKDILNSLAGNQKSVDSVARLIENKFLKP